MRTSDLAFLAGLLTVVAGDRLPGIFHRLAARQAYGYGYQFPPFPIPTGISVFPSGTTGSILSTAPGTIGTAGPTGAPYVNTATSAIGTAFTSFGTISATPVSNATATDPKYPTHGPYPFPSSKESFIPSGTVGTGISQSATISANATFAAPTDPSASRVYPTHGPYPFPSSLKSRSYSASSVIGTIGTAASYDPSASPSISANATTISPSGTAPPYSFNISAIPSISANGTSILPSGSAPIFTGASSSLDPSTNGTSSTPYSTGIGTGTGTVYPSSITASPTTLGTGTIFTYTPSVKSQASEYYYHHRRPHHKEHHEGDGYN